MRMKSSSLKRVNCQGVRSRKSKDRSKYGFLQVAGGKTQKKGDVVESIICEEEPYLLELVQYLHFNPLRANIVPDLKSLDVYPWCGHGV